MNKEMTKEKNIDLNKIETIFDHNITQEELENSYITNARSKEEYIKEIENDNYLDIPDSCYNDLASLYTRRGDYVTAKKYHNMQSKKALKRYEPDPNEDIHVTEINGHYY